MQPGSPNAARGFDLEPVALTNRANDPDPFAQVAWKKCEADGLIVSRLGVLDNDLGKVWQPDQPHVAVRQLRDWFAQFPYLSKLRDPQVLSKAISEALARADAKYGIADRFDDAKGEYRGGVGPGKVTRRPRHSVSAKTKTAAAPSCFRPRSRSASSRLPSSAGVL